MTTWSPGRLSAAAALVAGATPIWSPLESDADANKIPAQSETESPAKLPDNEPRAPTTMFSPTLSIDFFSRSILAFTPALALTSRFASSFWCLPAIFSAGKSCALTLLRTLCTLFCSPVVCFQYLADSFCKIPGVGVPLRHLRALCACPSAGGSQRYHLPFVLSLLYFHTFTNCSRKPIDLQHPSFHPLTNPFSRNFFVLTSIQNARVSPLPYFSTGRKFPFTAIACYRPHLQGDF